MLRSFNIIAWITTFLVASSLLVGGILTYFVIFYNKDLPDHNQLKNYEPPITTRIYAANGNLLEEYAFENRIYLPISAIPKLVINSFISAEDKNFYQHPGIDIQSLFRATFQNITNIAGNRNLVGGSTITQQVVKNFLLTNERTITRKIKEAILSFRITRAFSKHRILELYLNQIYLGSGSYGVASAALNYFNKSLDELNIEEVALLAAMPKAPGYFDPRKNMPRAKLRRDYVIERMFEDGYINAKDAKDAIKKPITLHERDMAQIAKAEFFVESVRREIAEKYGSDVLYGGGLTVHTTLNPELQAYAEKSFREGIYAYDRKRGYRGTLGNIGNDITQWKDKLKEYERPKAMEYSWNFAVVLGLEKDKALIGIDDGVESFIPFNEMSWAKTLPKKPSDILKIGDVIYTEKLTDKAAYTLRQVPAVNGGFVVQDPASGKVLAMVGGYSYKASEFNRVMQANRQPGSAFKPFVYLTALEHGYNPGTMVLDGPISLYQGPGLPMWTPKNYDGEFMGPIPLHTALEKSRNTISVRLASTFGIDSIVDIEERFGINQNPPKNYSTALGSAETTLLKLNNAYAMIANGGKKVKPILIERIQDRYGRTIYKSDERNCQECQLADNTPLTAIPPQVETTIEQVSDPESIYQLITMMEGVCKRGTAAKAAVLGKTVAGKTGTTNDSHDIWFLGFTPELVAGTYIGFDQPKSLGKRETGSSGALPIFISFMQQALKDRPDIPFTIPEGISLAKDYDGEFIAYKKGSEPTNNIGINYEGTSEPGHHLDHAPIGHPTPPDDSLPFFDPDDASPSGIY